MSLSLRTQLSVFSHILRHRLGGTDKYPLVLMLEPLFACNFRCAGCGKIQYPPDVLRKRMTPEECWGAAEECGAPMVTLAGGEPLMHERIDDIVSGFVARGRTVYLCTNALLLEKSLGKFKPSSRFVISVHLDGLEHIHDRVTSHEGAYRTAVVAIKAAKAAGFTVMTNSTIYQGESPEEHRKFFDELMALGIDGMTISPGYAYGKASKQELFLQDQQTRAWFRETLKDWRRKGWKFNHSPFFLDFLEGKREYDCTPWGTPVRNVFGWQRPCYLHDDGGYAAAYKELIETTDWSKYGRRSGNPKCANCLLHSGYEPSAVIDMFSTSAKFLELLRDMMSISRNGKG